MDEQHAACAAAAAPDARWPLVVIGFGGLLTLGWILGIAYALLWLVDVV
ncbi:hypothetical protein [Salinarimonas soli]|nr:hypothetical protein [Salinarimonas soli]